SLEAIRPTFVVGDIASGDGLESGGWATRPDADIARRVVGDDSVEQPGARTGRAGYTAGPRHAGIADSSLSSGPARCAASTRETGAAIRATCASSSSEARVTVRTAGPGYAGGSREAGA